MSRVLFQAALHAEATKFRRARVPLSATILLTAGIGMLVSSMLLAVHGSDPQLAAKLGALADPGGWEGYLSTASQITAIAGLLGFGVVISWTFGREFADGTITGLFALPAGRGTIALAKFAAYIAWATVVAALLPILLLVLGSIFGLGPLSNAAWQGLAVQAWVTLLTALLAAPAAFAATLGRGLLPGIATVIAIVVLAQVAALSGGGAWFPFSSPGLWATGGSVTAGQLALVLPTTALFTALTVTSWQRLQLDK